MLDGRIINVSKTIVPRFIRREEKKDSIQCNTVLVCSVISTILRASAPILRALRVFLDAAPSEKITPLLFLPIFTHLSLLIAIIPRLFLKKKSSFHVLLIQKQKKESGNKRFRTARIKYLMLERKKDGWRVAHGETSWNGKVHPVYLSLSRPSAPAVSARSNIGGVAASATLHSAGVALRLLT